ncbi:TetR/AcrR family transcriptional regulator [Microbacterium paludicola]|uniref:TetR/AcrR family transcriptional regulator n=1 Tax=Microbacterium paludicola TaxID=300019 RepID=A0A4Y9FVP1_9MICO|nr:TetR-like C-terminal domain-containing protein [Microbacterium paludicola]MBF0816246.1 TetR/AcrR family transcriptional regulator [Microbacterium paludicola]TFU33049.1 TetR/AcrR family transcriptional regulator [Microbacterium paludicola]
MATKTVGRPPLPEITDALLRAAERIMESEGFSKLTVDRLVTEVRTTRPTFYRRYPSIAHVAFDVIKMRFGTGTPVGTGTLRGDLLKLQREDVAMFSSPLLRNNLPGLLESVRTDPDVRDLYRDSFIMPRRANVGDVIAEAAQRGELDASVSHDVELVCDTLLGPVLARAVLPIGQPLDDYLARETVDQALRYLNRTDV